MRTYQTLSLIGCIIGLFLMLFLFGIAGLGTIFNNTSLNLTQKYGNITELVIQQQKHSEDETLFSSFASGTAFSLILFIIAITITFVVRNVKIVGIILIILGMITVAITRGWGIIPFAFLLPAGIVALREKKQVNNLVGK
jgi:hypothetical protein